MDDDKIIELRKRIDNHEYKSTRTKPQKKRRKKKKKINIVTVLFIAFLLYVLFTVMGQEQVMRRLDDERERKIAKKIELEQEVSLLREDALKIDDPETFLQLIEKIARDEYKMVKPYETLYIDKNKNNNKFIKGIGE